MPVRHARSETRGRPPFGRRGGVGKNGSTRSHNGSGSSAAAIPVHATSPTRIRYCRFCYTLLVNPGAFHWRGQPLSLVPAAPRYTGKIVILIDEVSQSQAEYTAMAFRSAPNATVVGSTTAGADGNVSAIPLPGGLRSMISGIGVFYPDKKPTQRVGIIPDIEAKPTLQGIRSGRDEVLEVALRHILGPDVPAAVIEQMAKQ